MDSHSPWILPASLIALGLILVATGATTSGNSLRGETDLESLQPARWDSALPHTQGQVDSAILSEVSPSPTPQLGVQPSPPDTAQQSAPVANFPPRNSNERTALTYNGRSFDEWQASFLSELNTETRLPCLPALICFGRNGYGPEATATILQALEAFPQQVLIGGDSDGEWTSDLLPFNDDKLLESLVSGVLALRDVGEPALLDATRHGQRAGRSLAWYCLARNDSPTARATIRLALHKGPGTDRRTILTCLADCSPMTVASYQKQIVRALIERPLRDTAWQLLSTKTDAAETLRTTLLSNQLKLNQKRELLRALTTLKIQAETLDALLSLSEVEEFAELKPEFDQLKANAADDTPTQSVPKLPTH